MSRTTIYPAFPAIPTYRTTSAVIAVTGGPLTIFTIANGIVQLHGLFGRVTTTAIGAAATTLRLLLDATVAGTVTYLCAASADIQSAAIGSFVGITGNPADQMWTSPATVGAGSFGERSLIVDPGVLQAEVSSGGTTGTIAWTAIWSPLAAGATLT